MNEKPHFNISAHVIKQLGEELVSDEITAILELVKNAYDADASYARVIVETKEKIPDEGLFFSKRNGFSETNGYLVVEDGGIGMTHSEIENGWLRISYSAKRQMHQNGILTPKERRTPLGEKGLGRLSTQRLGSRLEMFTHKELVEIEDNDLHLEIIEENENRIEHHIAFNWDDFTENTNLSSVPVFFESTKKKKPRKGTRLIITSLRDKEVWESESTKNNLINQLSQLIFPFREVKPFRVYLIINGQEIKLDSISEKIRDLAVSRFILRFDGEKLFLKGKIRLNRLQSSGTGLENEIYKKFIAPDNGEEFFKFLTSKGNKNSLKNLEYVGNDGWLLSFSEELNLDSIGGLSLINNQENPKIANPGAFYGEIDEFFLHRNMEVGSVFGKLDEFKKFVGRHTGVRLFRDGFGIRPYGVDGQDWLQFSSGQTSGRSFYSPRPGNLIGFIEISAEKNKNLQDKTDREGLVTSAYSRNFFSILTQFVKLIEINFNSYGRNLNQFRKIKAESLSSFLTTDEQINEIKQVSISSQKIEEDVINLNKDLKAITSSIEDAYDRSTNTPLLASKNEIEFQETLKKSKEKLHEAQELIITIQNLLNHTKKLENIADTLEPKIRILEEQIIQFSELASLGLIAEALTHESNNIADRLANHTKNLSIRMRNTDVKKEEFILYTEYVKSAISSLRKQLDHLSPSLRYLRETSEEIYSRDYILEIKKFYEEGRFFGSGFRIILEEPFENFQFTINRGKITQVFDNLILNSEYWLKEFVARKVITNPHIVITSKRPFLFLWDNGLGIEPSIESSIFQPFVTTKPKNFGRGLGLFITKELLDSNNCSIELLSDRNIYKRQYIFRINLVGVIHV